MFVAISTVLFRVILVNFAEFSIYMEMTSTIWNKIDGNILECNFYITYVSQMLLIIQKSAD